MRDFTGKISFPIKDHDLLSEITLAAILPSNTWNSSISSSFNNRLAKWETVNRDLVDGDLGLGGFKAKNLALLAKRGWRYLEEEDSLWCRGVRSIHGKDTFNWH